MGRLRGNRSESSFEIEENFRVASGLELKKHESIKNNEMNYENLNDTKNVI